MESVGDDPVVDPQAHPDTAERERGGRFDPGIDTGYLRRTPRDYALSPEVGAAPFDPGPGTGYDERRAAKAAKRRQREERRTLSERRRRDRELELQEARDEMEGPAAGRASLEAALQSLCEPQPPAVEPAPDRPPRLRRPASPATRTTPAARPSRLARPEAKSTPGAAQIRPGVEGPVRKRGRAAENRRRVAATRRGLFWPTAKAGLAVTLALALGAGLGSALGLPVPRLDSRVGNESLANSASLFGVDAGTPQGLASGYVFPLLGLHDFGEKDARFGAERYGHVHEGQDIFGKTGTPEVAVHDGVVVDRGKNTDPDDGGRGNYLAIYSPDDNHSFVYMHMLKPSPVLLGKQVHAGQVVGQLGCTGSCDGPHLHFEVRIGRASLGADTKAVDPLPYLQQWPQPTPG